MIRRAQHADLGKMHVVASASESAPHWPLQEYERLLLTDALLFIAEEEGTLMGFLVVTHVGDVAEIESIVIVASHRRRGLAKQLCEVALANLRELSIRDLLLEVRRSNETAVALYRSLGFEERGVRRGYYSNPVEDAVLMMKPI